jgi:predicted ATPase/DNA-binding winged helix-turn-helix (wHTH) protein
MERVPYLTFGPFRLDTERKRIWRDDEDIHLRRTSFEVLQMLVESAGEVVTKEHLIEYVWAGRKITRTAMRVCLTDIRQALGDDVKAPQYIETVGRKGYRFIGPKAEGRALVQARKPSVGFEHVVGRDAELILLNEWFGKARRGHRQIAFVTGEPGIGKTTVVEMFLARVRTEKRARIGRGQCIEQYGVGEPYLPILDAFGRMCREPGGGPIIELLTRYAPTWMIQMPGLVRSEDLASLQQRIQGANQQRMLREMADALEALTQGSTFILVLEDLHWSDYSTLELLSYLVQRQERLRFMIIGTYRPVDLIAGHPLKKLTRELQVHGQCEELPLAPLSQQEIATYVSQCFPEIQALRALIELVQRRTEGNALFMVNMVNMLHEQLVERDGNLELPVKVEDLRIPDNLRQLIEEKIDRLRADDRQILEAGSVEGREFSSVAIAEAIGKNTVDVEERCAALMRQNQFIQETEIRKWPDGTTTVRYEFLHALYHEVFYGRVTPSRRLQSHLRIGERLERGYGDQTQEIAAELAIHFERAEDLHRAVRYLQQAAEYAMHRLAYQESISHLTKALELLRTFADTPDRAQTELKCQISLGVALTATKGYAAPEVKQAYDRARELCQQIGQPSQIVPILRGLAAFYYTRAELATARELAEQLLVSVQDQDDESLLMEAHFALGGTLSNQGEFTSALHHLNLGQGLYDPQKHYTHALMYGQDPGVTCLSRASYVLWSLGYPDQSLTKSQESLVLAEKRAHPYSLTYALVLSAILHQLRREPQMAQIQAEAAMTISLEHGFSLWKSMSEILRAWAITIQGNPQDATGSIQTGIASWRTSGAEILLSYYLSLQAEVCGRERDFQGALSAVNEALSSISHTDDRWWAAELYRLKGELLLQVQEFKEGIPLQTREQLARGKGQKVDSFSALLLAPGIQIKKEAEVCFQQALRVACQQQAKSLELRAAMSLARVWRQQNRIVEARSLLLGVYSWFTEGLDTVDLQEARALLSRLEQTPTEDSSSEVSGQ